MYWISTRKFFRAGDLDWDTYQKFIGLPQLSEVRTIDGLLNHALGDGNIGMTTLEEIPAVRSFLPKAVPGESYRLLFTHALAHPVPERPDLVHLGYDLSDDTWTSSLLNCGVWENDLAPIAQRVNQYGLLTLEDALLAQTLLPQAWKDDHHALVTIWTLYEVIPDQGAS